MSNFWQRSLTGIAFVAVVIAAIVSGFWTSYGLLLLVSLLGTREFILLFKERISVKPWAGMVHVLALFLAALPLLDATFHQGLSYIPVFTYLFLVAKEVYRTTAHSAERAAIEVFATLYSTFPFLCLIGLGMLHGSYSSDYSYELPLGFFLLMWTNDTGAYLVGRSIGKNKLLERVSPGKTWEGFIGGVVLNAILAFFLYDLFPVQSRVHWMVLGLLIALGGTLGDLFQSRYKRDLGVKDSGNILPGHGGILDRFDGVLFAAPLALAYLHIIQSI